ncbi:hypothetical protein L249_4060, partial [Ophiocordyceps polyrhachis-furcata BCC 54312]
MTNKASDFPYFHRFRNRWKCVVGSRRLLQREDTAPVRLSLAYQAIPKPQQTQTQQQPISYRPESTMTAHTKVGPATRRSHLVA